MNNREYIIKLYEIYKDLLNEKEKSYFEYYFYEDYSLNEIADLYDVSKAYASKYLNKINNKLLKYEKSLKINDKKEKLTDYLNEIDNKEIRNKIEELL